MKTLRLTDTGPLVQLLQTALARAGFDPGPRDGIFGPGTRRAVMAFQDSRGLQVDGVAGSRTHQALMPYYLGYVAHTVRRGDTLYRLAMTYGSTIRAVEIANPGLDPLNLPVGSIVVVPLRFPVVATDIAFGSTALRFAVLGLAARYPFLNVGEIGRSVMGKPLYRLTLGAGENRVLYNGSHHANEWITTPVLLKFVEDLARAAATGGSIYDIPAAQMLSLSTIGVVPAVNPDGIDLVVGELTEGTYYDAARAMAQNYPDIPFPSGWKANITGVDLNLQYPAGWEEARRIKFEQGYTMPGPRDYVGAAPLAAPESRAMFEYTREFDPALILAYHTQGQVIYWRFLDYNPPNSAYIGERFALSSGYALESTPYGSGFAGYKDWFIQDYNRPGYTIEAGEGENPLPIEQFPRIYEDNVGIMALGAVLTSPDY